MESVLQLFVNPKPLNNVKGLIRTKLWIGCLLCMSFGIAAHSQEYSNKGKEFWIGYGNHEQMFSTNGQGMELYITSDVNTTVLVEIPGVGYSQNVTITANQVTSVLIPNTAALINEGLTNKGIHVVAQRPVVVYAHIYFQSVSGASLCLPVNTLGLEYYSINYTQIAQTTLNANSLSFFFVVATESGTTVEITPAATTKTGKPAGVPFTINMNRGDVYQVLSSNDLTGSIIKSINNGSGCKKLAVFSGSGRIGIGCGANVSSSDNLIQQVYPTETWGKKFVTVPSANRPRNFYRIMRPDPSSNVTLNGTPIPSGSFTNNFYYEFENTQTNVIESDKPIMVAQYFTAQSCGENVPYGDPEMIFLNPVEQTISDATLTSMRLVNPNNNYHFINVVVKNNAQAINSFKIDGVAYNSFTPVPQDPGYAYAQIPLVQGTHHVTCKLGFNAIAYGYAQFESYGYSAGTNLRDLYQFISINNKYATVNFPAGCKSSPLNFSIVFPFQPDQIRWQFNGLFPDTTILNPAYDSTWTINGKMVYQYRLAKSYQFNDTGIYPISVLVNNPSVSGCNGQQTIDYDLQIFERPKADFNIATNGCLSDSVQFIDRSVDPGNRPITKWGWDFGDGAFSNLQNPLHKYNGSQLYNVRFSMLTDVGCLSDTVVKSVAIGEPPKASFTISNPLCANKNVQFQDTSKVNAASIAKWYWDYGDGVQETVTDINPRTHQYAVEGMYKVRLMVETAGGCASEWLEKSITIHPNPVVDFKVPDICMPVGAASFTNLSTISDSTENLFKYKWYFGDSLSTPTNPDSSQQKNPLHYYKSSGPFQVTQIVTSGSGCATQISRIVDNVHTQPKIDYLVPSEVCLKDTIRLELKSSASTGEIFNSLYLDLGKGKFDTTITDPGNSNLSIPVSASKAGTLSLRVFGKSVQGCYSDTLVKVVTIDQLPVAKMILPYPACVNNVISFNDASVAMVGSIANWSWDLGDGTLVTKSDSGTVVHAYQQAGSYDVTLKVETALGCASAPATAKVNITAVPLPSFSAAAVCTLDAAAFKDSSRIEDGTENKFLYNWDFGDGTTATQKNPQHQFSQAGTYPVKLEVTSGKGCIASITKNYSVNGNNPVANFNLSGGGNICSIDSLVLVDQSTVDFGTATRMEIFWDYLNAPTNKQVLTNPLSGTSYSHQYPVFSAPSPKNYQVRVVTYSGNACFSDKIQNVEVHPMPSLVFDPIDAVCANAIPFDLIQAREKYGLSGTKYFAGSGINSQNQFDPSLAGSGIHPINFRFTSDAGCQATAQQTIQVIALPAMNAGPDMTVLDGGSATLAPFIRDQGLSFIWSPPTGLSDPRALNPVATPADDMIYTLTVKTPEGCMSQDDVAVRILKKPFIPNTFTPNGDGYNDVWEIPNLSSYMNCVVEIYNPQGQLLFRSIGYNNPWDGTWKGKPLPVGTYYYVIDPRNSRPKMAGYVTIIR